MPPGPRCYKAPEEIVYLEDMAMTPTGKVDRVALKRWAQEANAAEVA